LDQSSYSFQKKFKEGNYKVGNYITFCFINSFGNDTNIDISKIKLYGETFVEEIVDDEAKSSEVLELLQNTLSSFKKN
jgi:hypothetical protein